MACRMIGAKQLSKPMQVYYQLDFKEQTSVKIIIKIFYILCKKMHLNMSAVEWRPYYLGINMKYKLLTVSCAVIPISFK